MKIINIFVHNDDSKNFNFTDSFIHLYSCEYVDMALYISVESVVLTVVVVLWY